MSTEHCSHRGGGDPEKDDPSVDHRTDEVPTPVGRRYDGPVPPRPAPPGRRALLVADGVVRIGRLLWAAAPQRLRRGVEDRFFYAIFQVTRVENDAYGWRPPEGPGPRPARGAGP